MNAPETPYTGSPTQSGPTALLTGARTSEGQDSSLMDLLRRCLQGVEECDRQGWTNAANLWTVIGLRLIDEARKSLPNDKDCHV